MTKHAYRLITLIALCSMFVAALTYSRAMAENPGDGSQESSMCMLDTSDAGTFEEAAVSSADAAWADEEFLGCTYASCRTSSDCPDDHPAAPFFCGANRCCVPL